MKHLAAYSLLVLSGNAAPSKSFDRESPRHAQVCASPLIPD